MKFKKSFSKTICVSPLPNDISGYDLKSIFSKHGEVEKCFISRTKNLPLCAYITYANELSATKSLEWDNTSIQGTTVHVTFRRQTLLSKSAPKETPSKYFKKHKEKNPRNARIVVRNLSFKVSEKSLRKYFEMFGKVTEVVVLRKNGLMTGCGFVQFASILSAHKAVNKANMSSFLDRPIAVDFAIAKDRYMSLQRNSKGNVMKTSEVMIQDSEDEEEEIKREVEEEDKEIECKTHDDDELENEDKEKDSAIDSMGEIRMEEEHKDEKLFVSGIKSKTEEEEVEKEKRIKIKKKGMSKDVAEGRTVFVQNINFNSTDLELKDLMSKFGEVKNVSFCFDGISENFKGTAFVQFQSKESVASCLSAVSDTLQKGRFELGGRELQVMEALSRDKIYGMKKEHKKATKQKKDSRNIYLSNEGVIREGTLAAKDVSKTDMRLRFERQKVKKRLLKNINNFISPVRLCVHNIPLTITDSNLKKIFRENSPGGSSINECRIMRELKSLNSDGFAASKGFAFVSFTQHEAALHTLRSLNNNPNIFNKNKRPIVEFSIENRLALRAQQKRAQRSKEKNPNWITKYGNEVSAPIISQETKSNTTSTQTSAYTGDPSFRGAISKAGGRNKVGPKIRSKISSGKITRNQLNMQYKNKFRNNKRGDKRQRKVSKGNKRFPQKKKGQKLVKKNFQNGAKRKKV